MKLSNHGLEALLVGLAGVLVAVTTYAPALLPGPVGIAVAGVAGAIVAGVRVYQAAPPKG